ncbi:hypothetical protein [Priestia megaterium]|uniref:hypothetical protein n=1 Tax=Priestia megaterium TaxID=1404 RepID=UPI002E21D8F2|nr:hypothetical protein [Priestia megaterium]
MANVGLLQTAEDGLLLNRGILNPCSGSACANFATLPLETEISVVMDSGDTFTGIFKGFNEDTCTATLQVPISITPPSSTNFLIDCTKVAIIALGPIS